MHVLSYIHEAPPRGGSHLSVRKGRQAIAWHRGTLSSQPCASSWEQNKSKFSVILAVLDSCKSPKVGGESFCRTPESQVFPGLDQK